MFTIVTINYDLTMRS